MHISSNSPPASVKGATWLTWPPTRWKRPIGLHPRGHFNHDHRPARNANVCSLRPPTRSRRPTITSPYRKIGSTPGCSKDRAQRRSTHTPPPPLDAVLCTSRTPSPFFDDRRTWICTACGHVARLRALKFAQPFTRVLSKAGRRNMAAIQNGGKLH